MSHLTNCSEIIQQTFALSWNYPETIDWTLATFKSIKDIQKGEDLGTKSNNNGLFPIFFHFIRYHHF